MPYRLLALPFLQMGSLVAETWSAVRGDTPHADVPPMTASAGAIAEAVLDRTFTLAINLVAGVPNSSEIRAARELERTTAKAVEAEGWLENPHAFHADPPPVAAYELGSSRAFAGATRLDYQHLSFESLYEPHPALPTSEAWLEFEENRNAHAYVLEHEGEPDRPWIVCVHGFGMGGTAANFSGFNVAQIHRELGLNVLMPVLPLHGPRAASRMSGGDILSSDLSNMVHVFAQAVFDIRRMLGWLRLRTGGDVPIGLWGVSLGGYTSALVAGFEPDLACVIAGIPPTDFASVARDNQPWIMRGYEREMSIDWQSVRKLTHMVSPLSFDPLVPKERRFIYAGIADRVVRPDQARALWRHWGRPEILWYAGGHVASQWKSEVQGFIEQCLSEAGMLVDEAA